MSEKKLIVMAVFNAVQYDARVIRAAEAAGALNRKTILLSCNSNANYKNSKFESISYTSTSKGMLLLLKFNLFIFRYIFKKRKKIVLLYFHDYYLTLAGLLLSWLCKIPWIYDAHELLLERKEHKHSYRSFIFLSAERLSIRSAILVVAANEERRKIIKGVYKLKQTISILNITPPEPNLEVYTGMKDKTLLYQGYMSKKRNVPYFIHLLKNLPEDYKLKLIGGGPDIESFKSLAISLGLSDRVKFTGLIPTSEIMEESKSCKIGIVYYEMDGLNNLYCSPNKLYTYAQLRLPMLFSAQPFLKKIASNYNIGEVIESQLELEDVVRLVEVMVWKYDDYTSGMNSFVSDYNSQRENNKLREAIFEVLKDV